VVKGQAAAAIDSARSPAHNNDSGFAAKSVAEPRYSTQTAAVNPRPIMPSSHPSRCVFGNGERA
jgi:hypothetical protein